VRVAWLGVVKMEGLTTYLFFLGVAAVISAVFLSFTGNSL
jgi:hypothetical protein